MKEKKMGLSELWIWKGKQEKKDGCYQVVDLNLYRKEKWGLDKEVYLNNKNFTRKKTKKKDGVGWIVNLKLSKKLKWKWEKKKVLPSCVFE